MPAPSTVTSSVRVSAEAPAGSPGPAPGRASGHAPGAVREDAPRPPRSPASARPPAEAADDLLRWAVFSCLLVPVVLTVYGTSFGGTASAAFGLAAVAAVCRLLLRRSERTAARPCAEEAGADAGASVGASAGADDVRDGEARTAREGDAAHAPGMYGTAGSRRSRGRQGAHRGSRACEGSAPGD
ncbi:hypothetical protein OG349_23840 [Streptomyces sp. NBC_01317]|uniref:hypothetical protein n=1 Tax=Streptomyces sp. NBC_01317 TaxID=2903822 RepID=UPI002E148C6C|nr:hypothetical protein OG349_23840 [Streptomyces sp. NBC_01317]